MQLWFDAKAKYFVIDILVCGREHDVIQCKELNTIDEVTTQLMKWHNVDWWGWTQVFPSIIMLANNQNEILLVFILHCIWEGDIPHVDTLAQQRFMFIRLKINNVSLNYVALLNKWHTGAIFNGLAPRGQSSWVGTKIMYVPLYSLQ